MTSTTPVMSLSEALKILNSNSMMGDSFKINMISDQQLTQYKIFLKARLKNWNVNLSFIDEKYNGFIEKCFLSEANENANLNLVVIDSYSLFVHPNLRSSTTNFETTVEKLNDIKEQYLAALRNLCKNTQKKILIQIFNLKNELFSLQAFKEIQKEDISWGSFVQEIYQLALENKHVHVFSSENLSFNQLRFVEIGEYLISENASKTAEQIAPFLYSYLNGIMPNELKSEKKLLITDLDNTFWGGILGDDGIENLQFTETTKGKIHWLYQKYLNFLSNEGIILAVCSKNGPEHVEAAFNQLDLICPKEKFSLISANWDLKSQNIQSICQKLNLLPESTVFVDDNLLEIEEVQRSILGITCIPFPNKANELEKFFLTLKQHFSKAQKATSIKLRQDSYQALNEITKAKGSLDSAEQYYEYLKSIDMLLDIRPLAETQRERAFELINKTNQFNFHGKRYSAEEFGDFEKETWTISVKDKFADHGIVGLVILQENHLEQFVLSCRVFSRFIEDAVFLVFQERIKTFSFKKTEKNQPTVDFLLRSKQIATSEELSKESIETHFLAGNNLVNFPGKLTKKI